jgi:hypothetical protein
VGTAGRAVVEADGDGACPRWRNRGDGAFVEDDASGDGDGFEAVDEGTPTAVDVDDVAHEARAHVAKDQRSIGAVGTEADRQVR